MRKNVDLHATGFSFLNTELDVGTNFAKYALGTTDSRKRTRNAEYARKAHESFMKHRHEVELSPGESNRLAAKLVQLEKYLGQLFG